MMTGDGQFGPIEMGGMFTILKIRDGIRSCKSRTGTSIRPGTSAVIIRLTAACAKGRMGCLTRGRPWQAFRACMP